MKPAMRPISGNRQERKINFDCGILHNFLFSMKPLLLVLVCLHTGIIQAQIKWHSSIEQPSNAEWNNYSTSYVDRQNLISPIIVTAIPYNGNNSNFGDIRPGLDLMETNTLFRFRSNLSVKGRKLFTYDSAEVYFLAPGIYSTNASQFEYRVLLNASTIIKPWSSIQQFTDSSFDLSDFKKGMAFLGGYRTDWDNFLELQIRKRGTDTTIASALVYWKQIKPVIKDIFTDSEFIDFLAASKRPLNASGAEDRFRNVHTLYDRVSSDAGSMPPPKLTLSPKNDNLIFYLEGDIFKKEALEYQLVKNNKVIQPWKQNDFDNSFIWIRNIEPGAYDLQIRYRRQRHNTISYSFYMGQVWYKRPLFLIMIGAISLSVLFLIYRLQTQKKRASLEKYKKEKMNLELKAVRSQLNPHFVFNALNSIQSLVNRNEMESANYYLTEFSQLLRETLKNKDAEFSPLEKEIVTLKIYLGLEKLRFRFGYSFEVGKDIEVSSIEIPTLLVQPLIENAIKHGAGPLYENGLLKILIFSQNKNLVIRIIDNGKGFDPGMAKNGYGLQLVKDRISLLNSNAAEQRIHLSFNTSTEKEIHAQLTFENWI
jgi:hypothetical protein